MSNNDAGKDGTIVTTVNGNATASGYVKGYGLQWNMLPIVVGPAVAQPADRPDGAQVRQLPLEPGRLPPFNPDMAAERLCLRRRELGLHPRLDQGGRARRTAPGTWCSTPSGKNLDTMRPWPQNALLTVNTSSKTLTATPAYYVFRHVSQYVDPGAKGVATTGGDALAFKNPDGTIVAVIYNSGAARNYIVSVAGKRCSS